MKRIRFFALIISFLMLISSFASCTKVEKDNAGAKKEDTKKEASTNAIEYDLDASGIFRDAGIEGTEPLQERCVWSNKNVVTESMYTYFFVGFCKTYARDNADYMKSLGYEENVPLKEQNITNEMTWYEFLMGQSYREVERLLSLADCAVEAGIKLDETDYASVEGTMDVYKSNAEKAGMPLEIYIEGIFNSDVNECTVRKGLVLELLAKKYYLQKIASIDITDEMYEAFYSEHEDSLASYDCISVDIDSADAYCLTSSADEMEFIENYRSYLTENNFNGDYEKFKDMIEKMVAGKYRFAQYAGSNSSFDVWLRDAGRRGGDIYTEDHSNGMTTVTMVLSADGDGKVLYRNEDPLKNFILITFENEDSAKAVLSEYESDPTADNFAKISEKHHGVTVTGATKAYTNKALRDYLFSAEAVDGEAKLITDGVSGKAYIVYKQPDGRAAWLNDTELLFLETKQNEAIDEIRKTSPVEYDPDKIYDVKE